ncbi:hypothetical protein ACFP81_05250 [Deinococcus lacus]|uniref:Uncharacterized protein n=1 Tax=Deinococcus lacus TaxID=392561 RepID=A0ABW1YD63_9DEIO
MSVGAPPSAFEPGLPLWATEGERFTLTLSLRGRYAGEQHWSITPERSAVVTRVQTDFGGVLPALRVQQTSRLHPQSLAELAYTETEGHRTPLNSRWITALAWSSCGRRASRPRPPGQRLP